MRGSRIPIALLLAALPVPEARAEKGYEVRAIDQSNSPGLSFGGTLYIRQA